MKQTFYSNGKLLITGEYTVLDGAKALALPTTYGQYLTYYEVDNDKHIEWLSLMWNDLDWFRFKIPYKDIIAGTTTVDDDIYEQLVRMLHHAHTLNPCVLEDAKGYYVKTKLTFPRDWGLGSSSTVINNIARWFSIDPYTLLEKSFGGSGYDIACARNNTPIVYQLVNNEPIVTTAEFKPAFKKDLTFVHLNQKQNSRAAIENYRRSRKSQTAVIEKINLLTAQALTAPDSTTFANIMEDHEAVMSVILETKTVKESLFPDFNGTIKSLGAWGGDFILAISQDDPELYFKSKGYKTIIPYNKMILNK